MMSGQRWVILRKNQMTEGMVFFQGMASFSKGWHPFFRDGILFQGMPSGSMG